MVALTIAGSDPSGGAGIQADLRTFEALGVTGVSIITALTVQNSAGVAAVHLVSGAVVAAQLEIILADVRPAAVKIGMLGSADQVEAVADALERHPPPYVVLDPILASTAGVSLLDEAGRIALRRRLFPLATLVTPNWHETQTLAGITIDNDASLREAARKLLEFGAEAVLVKGGHRLGNPVDVLFSKTYPSPPAPLPSRERGVGNQHPPPTSP